MDSVANTSKAKIGFIGLGLMGRPMGMNLLKAGHSLTVWNRTAARADELVAAGAKRAKSPREAAAGADVLITIVSDPPALEEVLWGTGGRAPGVGPGSAAMAALRSGAIYIDSIHGLAGFGAENFRGVRETGRAISGCAGDGRRLGSEEGRAGVHDRGGGGDAEGGRADFGSDG